MICLLCIMTAGYAAFQTNLSISAKGNIKKMYASLYLKKKCNTVSGDGLYKDALQEDRCVYRGINPNNYITFNNEKAGWRIISVESDGTLKIMKATSIGDMAWDTTDSNNWARPATLNTYLNSTYYNNLSESSRKQIQTKTWDIGPYDTVQTLPEVLQMEKSKSWTGNIGLMTLSDIYNSSSNIAQCGDPKGYGDNLEQVHQGLCKNSSYIYTMVATSSINRTWLLTSTTMACVWHTYGDMGRMTNGYPRVVLGILPTLYLKSNIEIFGEGTKDNPFEIK